MRYRRLIATLGFFLAAASACAQNPSIGAGGVVHGASFLDPGVAGGALAPGCLFAIQGENLGPGSDVDPRTGVQAGSLPYDTSLAGVSVRIAQGGIALSAYVVFAWTSQVNAILPSNTPLGNVQVTVTYKGKTSAPAPARVAQADFGILSPAGGFGPGLIQNWNPDGSVARNTPASSARPGQLVVLWGTGLGAIAGPDNAAPGAIPLATPLEIYVGGKAVANVLYTGRAPEIPAIDELIFALPDDAPEGCFVPVQVRTGGDAYSNVVTMAVDAQGAPCTDRLDPFARAVLTGGRVGLVELFRLQLRAILKDGQAAQDFAPIDLGAAAFYRAAGDDPGLNPLYARPPAGLCTAPPSTSVLASLLQPGAFGTTLDAGATVSVKGSAATIDLKQQAGLPGEYYGLLGGRDVLRDGSVTLLPFLTGGVYTVTEQGGKDVGAFSQQAALEPDLTWINRDAIDDVDRSAGLTLRWSGGDPASQVAVIFGGGAANTSAGGFFCVADLAAGEFTVPPQILATVPPISGQAAMGAFLIVGAVPAGEPPVRFTARGLDLGYILTGTIHMKQVGFR